VSISKKEFPLLRTVTLALLGGLFIVPLAHAGPIDVLLKSAKGGDTNREAALAWREVVDAGVPSVLPLLNALDDASPAASNWMLSAVDAIVEKERQAKKSLPVAELEKFLADTKHNPKTRRYVYELITAGDAAAQKRLLAGMIADPSTELRREAIAKALADAKALKDEAARTKRYQSLFDAAREKDQVEEIGKLLKSAGVDVDVTAHFNFITDWQLIGPFDNVKGAGFTRVFDPEKKVDLTSQYPSKTGESIGWTKGTTDDRYGVVDLNKLIGKHKGAVAYAFATVDSPMEQPVEIRVGSNNAVQIFLNGERIFSKEEYHHGNRMDQYIAPGKLKKGANEILLKVCQNEQTQGWAQTWTFQLRISDSTGGKVPMTVRK